MENASLRPEKICIPNLITEEWHKLSRHKDQ